MTTSDGAFAIGGIKLDGARIKLDGLKLLILGLPRYRLQDSTVVSRYTRSISSMGAAVRVLVGCIVLVFSKLSSSVLVLCFVIASHECAHQPELVSTRVMM